MVVPDRVHEAVAAAGLGVVRTAWRAGAGRRNEVWLVALSAGGGRAGDGDEPSVVVRFLASAERSAVERAVLRWVAAAGAGVPVPEVLWAADAPVPVVVQRRLPGRRLAEVAPSEALADDVGAVLARVHGVAVAGGFGNLAVDLRGEDGDLVRWFTDRVRAEASSVVVTADDRRLVESTLERFDAAAGLLARQRSGLVHGDWSPDNLLVEGDRVTGVLDWEAAKAGPPAFDLGWWDWWSEVFGTPWPADRLLGDEPADDERDEVRALVVERVWVRELLAAHRSGEGDGPRASAARAGLSRRRGRRRRRS